MSFLEMLDIVNERLTLDGKEPIAFDHDCREGICGSCGMMINGVPHGPERGTATCQLHMRKFRDGDHDDDRAVARRELPARARPDRRPQRVRPDHRSRAATSARPPAAPPTATSSRSRRASPTRRWTRPRASAAARASPRARTAPRSCSPSAKLAAPQPDAAGPGRALGPHGRDGRDDGDVLRLVHEPPRVRGRVPEVDLDRLHRADEPRLREGAAQAAPPRRSDASRRAQRSATHVRRSTRLQARVARRGDSDDVGITAEARVVRERWCRPGRSQGATRSNAQPGRRQPIQVGRGRPRRLSSRLHDRPNA